MFEFSDRDIKAILELKKYRNFNKKPNGYAQHQNWGTEERISQCEDRTIEITQYDNRENRPTEREEGLRGLCGYELHKRSDFHIITVPEGEDKEKGPKRHLKKYWLEIPHIWQRTRNLQFLVTEWTLNKIKENIVEYLPDIGLVKSY